MGKYLKKNDLEIANPDDKNYITDIIYSYLPPMKYYKPGDFEEFYNKYWKKEYKLFEYLMKEYIKYGLVKRI